MREENYHGVVNTYEMEYANGYNRVASRSQQAKVANRD
jgi:hypothetical protein